MPISISLIGLKITRIEWDFNEQKVVTWYDLLDSDGKVREQGVAFFWKTPPSLREDETQPSNYFQLSAIYADSLASLYNDINATLTAVLLTA